LYSIFSKSERALVYLKVPRLRPLVLQVKSAKTLYYPTDAQIYNP
jgi:hypothetical protein